MLEIRPFRGIIYDKEKVGNIAEVTTPPYDVISSMDQELYYSAHPNNIIRIILGKNYPQDNEQENRYTRAKGFFKEWLAKGILKKEKKPAIYTYEKEYYGQGNLERRRGLLALMKLEEFGKGVIFPHEETLPKPGLDRLRLLQWCRANFNPIFSLYSDPLYLVDKYLKTGEALFEVIDKDGVKHRLGKIEDTDIINKICRAMEDKKLFLADGHHRYNMALKFRDEERRRCEKSGNGRNFVLMYFLNMDNDALNILPVSRVIGNLNPSAIFRLKSRLKDLFHIERLELAWNDKKEKAEIIVSQLQKKKESIFAVYWGGSRCELLTLKEEKKSFLSKVNTVILDKLIKEVLARDKLERGRDIDFIKEGEEAIDLVQKKKYQLAFFLKSLSLKQVKEVCLSGGKLPPKSTYFYPKPLSGVVTRDLDEEI